MRRGSDYITRMSTLTSDNIRHALSDVIDHDSGKDVVSAGMISGITISGAKVSFLLEVSPQDAARKAHLSQVCEQAVRALPGVESVTVVMTSEAAAEAPARKPAVWNMSPVENVRRVVAVASGKGGVGKSTVAAGIAQALSSLGRAAGLLDADIYGPSLPRMMGLAKAGRPQLESGGMLPHEAHGVQCMSVGFITGDEAAIFRGPMVSKTLSQLLRGTRWGTPGKPLDLLLVDMPPGTGDVQLSMSQQVPMSGVLIVTTPQEVAVSDARKALLMFLKVGVPVLGVVENMTGEVFGAGGGGKLAEEFGVPLLGEVALDSAVRKAADAGAPLRHATFSAIAAALAAF